MNIKNNEKRADMLTATVCLIYGIMMLAGGLSINVVGKSGDYGPAFMPRLMGSLVILLSIALLVSTIYTARKASALAATTAAKNEGDDDGETAQEMPEDYKSIIFTVVLLSLYMMALKPIGFAISSTVYCFLQMVVLAPAKPTTKQLALFGVIAVVLSLTVNYVFINVFSLMLPTGILG